MKRVFGAIFVLVVITGSIAFFSPSNNSKDGRLYKKTASAFYSPHSITNESENQYVPTRYIGNTDSNMTQEYHWPYGSSFSIHSDGTYLYAGSGSAVIIYKIRTDGQLDSVSEIKTNSRVLKILTSGTNLFIANQGDGLKIYSIENINKPLFISQVNSNYDMMDIVVRGNYVYAADGWYGGESGYTYSFQGKFKIIDISNITNPIIKSDNDMGGECTSVYVKGAYAYVISIAYASWDGMHSKLSIFDVSNATVPVLQGSIDLGAPIGRTDDMGDITIAGNYAFVTFGTAVKQIDVSNNQSPILKNTIALQNNSYAFRIEQSDSNLIICDRYKGLIKIRITDPSAPQAPVYYTLPGQQMDISFAQGYIYIASESQGINVLNSSTFAQITNIKKGHCPTHLLIDGDRLYLADGNNGIKIFKRSATGLVLSGIWSSNANSYGPLAIKGNYLFVGQGSSLTKVIDVSNPGSPQSKASIVSSPDSVTDLHINNNRLFLSQINDGISIYDITNPVASSKLGSFKPRGSTFRCKTSGNYAYVASDSGGLRVYNVSNPVSASEVGYYDPAGFCYDLELAGKYAYMAASSQGILVLDISDPSGPFLLNTYLTNDQKTPLGLAYKNSLLYVSTSFGGLYSYYCYQNGTIKEIGHHIPKSIHSEIFWGNDLTRPVVDTNNRIYVGLGVLGVDQLATTYTISRLDQSVSVSNIDFNLSQNFPNPFNPETTIKFNLNSSGIVKLEVYNNAGKLVAILANKYYSAGNHEIIWNASKFPSGIYLYRLNSGKYSIAKKMILLK